MVPEFMIGFMVVTGIVFWSFVFAWFVGWFGDKMGIRK